MSNYRCTFVISFVASCCVAASLLVVSTVLLQQHQPYYRLSSVQIYQHVFFGFLSVWLRYFPEMTISRTLVSVADDASLVTKHYYELKTDRGHNIFLFTSLKN